MRCAPAQIHTQQHLRPVLSFSTSRSSLDVHESAMGIHFAMEHPLELEAADLVFEHLCLTLDVLCGRCIVLAFREVEQLGGIGNSLACSVKRGDLANQTSPFAP